MKSQQAESSVVILPDLCSSRSLTVSFAFTHALGSLAETRIWDEDLAHLAAQDKKESTPG